ncbi:hypothetical protein F9C07_1382741 [Aspergillus flavus]|uniref:Arrestin domain protein n=1 Tax=Aspergillus flavus (strain ATCC 200026 / FGSC A1120 / IAM 13836 / NRRL 3357 / JCM 12722 / SRRC 167) TaxID=332952 RepID=A0A7G5K0E7_ASPFN|nr:uncharacterized protein G4B84_004602 [Aspergillus flavus NRRL3357]KAF7617898.1 hypothetical protein AFLA_006808 [Aspergillus flavus NRRL3357]QMW29267.1 hypothetical protein G4B84_004602 [Aspergillus flavus NRRL3357]QMW41339.1 hypothetical protein G4B11_004663 [Aspergillus flavus]QRD85577.1 hypothetical protein F9C07_1382741 [Aspergillus flavus]
MEAWGLQLTVPSTHTLLESGGESHAPPITGSIAIAVPSSGLRSSTENFPKFEISFTRSVTPKPCDVVVPSNNKSYSFFFKRNSKHKSSRNQNSPHATTQPEPNVETLVQYDLCHAPDEIDPKEGEDETWLKFSFYLPIPSNIPPTTETVLGSVSYAITATVAPSTISSTRILKDTQQIKMSRRVVSEPIRHIRQYPGERVLTELSMVPSQLYTDTPEEMKVAYSLEWVAHSTIAKGARDMEVKYVVGKELKWRVEETVKYLSISRGGNPQREAVTTTCKEQRVRQLCEGKQKGHWVANGGLQGGDHTIEIPFDINIPAKVKASDGIDLSSYLCHHQEKACDCSPSETTGVIVEHNLILEVITGQDTFDEATGRLVDRRPRMKSFNAVFPFPIKNFVSGDSISLSEFYVDDTLPRYDDTYLRPPNYATAR